MKKYFYFMFVLILTNCSNGLYDIWNSGGYGNPTLAPPVTARKSGDYFPFDLEFDNSSDTQVKYIVSDSPVSSYDSDFVSYDAPISITKDCVVSAYCYTVSEISQVVHFTYHILGETPEASVIVKPAAGNLRWDELTSGVEWTNTIVNYDLVYWLEFDFDSDGVTDYRINTGKEHRIVLSSDQVKHIAYNASTLQMSVSIRDKFGDLVMPGKISTYVYSHKKVLANSINSVVLSVSSDENDYFIVAGGPDNNNDNKIGINCGLYSFDYKQKMDFTIDSGFSEAILSSTTDYTNGKGVIFFTEDTAPVSTVYPVFNILANGSHGSIGSGFTGLSPFVFTEGDHYNLVYMKKGDSKNSVMLREYDLDGSFKSEKVVVDNLSIADRVVSVDRGNFRYNIAVEYFNSVRRYKNYIFDSNFSHCDIYNVGNNAGMDDYSTTLNQNWCGSIWRENSQYMYRAFSLIDSSMSQTIVVDYPFVSRSGICGIDGVNFGILYQAAFEGGIELFYRKASNDGRVSNKEMITSDGADRNFMRIKNSYAFWLEDNNPVMCRIF